MNESTHRRGNVIAVNNPTIMSSYMYNTQKGTFKPSMAALYICVYILHTLFEIEINTKRKRYENKKPREFSQSAACRLCSTYGMGYNIQWDTM